LFYEFPIQNGLNQGYGDDINLLEENMNTINKNSEIISEVTEDIIQKW